MSLRTSCRVSREGDTNLRELKKKKPVRFGTGNRCNDEESICFFLLFMFLWPPPSSSAGDSCSFGVERGRVGVCLENHAITSAISGGSYRRVQERPINLELQVGPSI